MRLTVVAALALTAAVPAVPATADPDHRYVGGCSLATVTDPTSWYALGTPDGWHGVMYSVVRATDGGTPPVLTDDPVEVRCDILVNGGLETFGALTSDGSFTAVRVVYQADVEDVVTVCAHVQVGTFPPTYHCEDLDHTRVVPGPVAEVLLRVAELVKSGVLANTDPTFCATLSDLAGRYGPVDVHDSGDVYLYGDTDEARWYDCPPYAPQPPNPLDPVVVGNG